MRPRPLLLAIGLALVLGADAYAAQAPPKAPGTIAAPEADGPDAGAMPWIPFELHNGQQIFVPVTINGQAATALLDSGAPRSVIDDGFAREIGAEPHDEHDVTGVNGQQAAGMVDGLTVQIGALTLNGLRADSLDLSGGAKIMGRPLPFVLGKEVFNRMVVDIDFPHKRIRFAMPRLYRPPAEAVAVPLKLEWQHILAPVSIEGQPPVEASLDLGSGYPITLSPTYAASSHLLEDRPSSLSQGAWGVGGMRKLKIATARTISFGGLVATDVPMTAADIWPAESPGTEARIGVPLLRTLRLIFNCSDDMLYVLQDPAAAPPTFDKNRLGFQAIDSRTGAIGYVDPGSPAALAGLKSGDRVASVAADGPAGKAQGRVALQALANLPAGVGIDLTMASGEVKHLILADYY